MDKITHEVRLNNWQTIITKCNNSGLSKRDWCIQNHVSEKSFYYWQRKLRMQAAAGIFRFAGIRGT